MSTYEISKSSLLSLKAEILRKQQELSKTRAENEVKIRNLKNNTPLEIKNKGLEQRQKNDISEEEQDLLKKSRSALEVKAKLYDKLSRNSSNLTDEQIEHNRRYLVRFDRKTSKVPDLPPDETEDDVDRYPDSDEDRGVSPPSYDPPKNPDEEWVEYVDCLGRTRTCLRKDLEYLKSKDKDLESVVESKRRNRERSRTPEPSPEPEPSSPESEITEENELLSNDMRREMLRRQWEKEEEELRNKSDIHYQDILFNEARTHGVGYYGFSKDEEERAKQQEALKKLRKETKEQQKKAQDLKSMREKQLAVRIKAAKNRKRVRMGLPPLEDEPEPAPEPQQPPTEEPKEINEREKILEELRKKHVRPWDYGKEGVKEHYEYSQEEWVDKKRKERPSEFAPPSAYRGDYKNVSRGEDIHDSNKSLRFTTKKSSSSQKEFEDITEDLSSRRKGVNPYKRYESSQHKTMEPVAIVNEVDDDEQDSLLADYRLIAEKKDDDDDAITRGKGVEVAPPSTFDYYGPSDAKKKKGMSTTNNVSDSIEAGLRYLREQMEKKQSSSRRDTDMFLS